MNASGKSRTLLIRLLLVLFITGYLPLAAGAVGSNQSKGGNAPAGDQTAAGTPGASQDGNEGTAWTIRDNYFKRYKWAKEFGPEGSDRVNKDGESEGNGQITVQGPIYKWPEKHEEPLTVNLPTKRDEAIGKHMVKTFGLPVSDTQFQVMSRLNDNMMLEEAFDPERWMWMENTMGAIKSTSAANSAANLGRNQSQGAIEFAQNFLPNFTVDPSNVWNRIRNELFIPMAVLLLLPGAVLSQVRAIVAQGTTVLGDVNPFDGILRSIVAIFLIPATYLVVNYGIDVSNAITNEIGKGYERVFGGNMYTDAACAQRRAFPIRDPNSNKNQIPAKGTTGNNNAPAGKENDPFAQLEAISFDVGASEQCGQGAGQNANGGASAQQGGGSPRDYRSQRFATGSNGGTFDSLVGSMANQNASSQGVQQGLNGQGQNQQAQQNDGKADEEAPVLVSTQRMVVNGANAALSSTWNVLCAFQMAYLYYLFCIGPVVAALWVWPMGQLRSALPSWVEGVVTLCFWSLFWNTTILLMAAFKNVGETGTITMTALNFLATASVKHAFDFAGLVKDAGAQVAKEAEKASKGGGGKGGKGHGDHAADGSDASKGGKQPGTTGNDSHKTDTPSAPAPQSTPAMSLSSPGGTGPGSGGDGGNNSKGLTASDVLPPPGERNGGSPGSTPGTSGNTGPDGTASHSLASADSPMNNSGTSPQAGPPPSDSQALAAMVPASDSGPAGGGGDGNHGNRGGDGGSPQTANASIDISGITSSLGGALGGLSDGSGAVPGNSAAALADSGAISPGAVLGLSGSPVAADGGTVAAGGPNGLMRTAAETTAGSVLGANPLIGGTIDAKGLGGSVDTRGIAGSVVPGVGGPTTANGTVLSGDAGPNAPGVGPGLGILGDAGLPPGAAPGQSPLGASPGGLPQTANSSFGAIPGNVMAPPPAAAPGADPIVANPAAQAYQAVTAAVGATFDASQQPQQLQAQPVQPQPIVSQPQPVPVQPDQLQAQPYQAQSYEVQQPVQYQAQPVQPQPIQAQQVQADPYQAQPVQPQPIQAQPQPAAQDSWTFQPIVTPVSLAYSNSLGASAPAYQSAPVYEQAAAPAPAPAHTPTPTPVQTPTSGTVYEGTASYGANQPGYVIIPAPAHAPAPVAPPQHYESGPAHHAYQGSPQPVDASHLAQGTVQGAGGGLAAALGRAAAPRTPANGAGTSTPSSAGSSRPQAPTQKAQSLQEQLGQSGIKNSRTPKQQHDEPTPPDFGPGSNDPDQIA